MNADDERRALRSACLVVVCLVGAAWIAIGAAVVMVLQAMGVM